MITSLNHITLAVHDIERSFSFYKDILDLKPLVKWNEGAYFLAGDFWFCLNVDKEHDPQEGYTHYAFSVGSDDFDSLSQRIIASGAMIFKNNTSPGNSLYFLDPDGHKLEIHVHDWKLRIDAKKKYEGSWTNVEWFV